MHKTSIALALTALTLSLATPAVAQISGSINRDAPTVTNSLQFKNGSMLKVSYTAIHFGEGRWQRILENADAHERFNAGAARRPIGSVKLNATVTASGREIAPGEYDLFFTAFSREGQSAWVLNLKDKNGDGEAMRWGMRMKEGQHDHKRMMISLTPGADTGSATIMIAFGKNSVSVPLKVGDVAKKKMKKAGIR